jgi:hypothetical protein
MASNEATSSAAQPAAGTTGLHLELALAPSLWLEAAALSTWVPLFEVAYKEGQWWSFPQDESLAFYRQALDNENARCSRNTDKFREYLLDFGTMEQVNVDNNRRRSLRLAWVSPNHITPLPGRSAVASAEQPASSWLETAIQPFLPLSAPGLETHLVPIFEIMYADGMLWSLPQELSNEIYENTYGAQSNWIVKEVESKGQFQAYIFDMEKMEYINIEADHQGPLRLAWISPGELTPSFTGQVPGAKQSTTKRKRR